jgi:hypothetical protein
MTIQPGYDTEQTEWPSRRVIGNVGGEDVLECGHRLPAGLVDEHYKVFVYGRRCSFCHAAGERDLEAEIRAHQRFLGRIAWGWRLPKL